MDYPRVHPESLEGFITNHVPCSVRYTCPDSGKVEHLVYDGMILWGINEDDTRSRIREFTPALLDGAKDPEGLSLAASFKLLHDSLPSRKMDGVFWQVTKLRRNEDDLYDAYDEEGEFLFTVAPDGAGRIVDANFMRVEVEG